VKLRYGKGAVGLAVVTLLLSGCALQAPIYQASIDNVSGLKRNTARPARVGTFLVQPGATGGVSIGIRGGSMNSPVGGHYAAYLAEALRAELALARRLDPAATIAIDGTLLSNDVDAAIDTGTGHMEARFVVTRDGQVRFDKVKRGAQHWSSSFAANVAVPAAQRAYPEIVQNLLGALFADPDFQAALQ
jgi:hypothetical protein